MVDSPGQSVSGIPLLETKFYIPKWRPGWVSRPRLLDRLQQGRDRTLTLISAPAGFGKTTLLAEWVTTVLTREWPVVWLSLDQGDNDPAFFWDYFITALQKVQPSNTSSKLGERALSLLHSPQPPPIESVLTTLINEVNAIATDVTLILDDYHVVETEAIHGAIAFLIDHLPPQLHLLMASRTDPPLALARLRARGELTELRVADLRFTSDEAVAFLNEVMGLTLSTADGAALEMRTEGWIAGLQLAALSMQGRDDVSGFVTAFSGDDRYIVDYLVEEVLQRQPEPVRRFLLQTAILDRLSGSLCNAVTDWNNAVTAQNRGKEMLEVLERSNLFVVPLDDKRQWYRYHHLFADVLHARLMQEHPDRLPTLHQRASKWYEQNGSMADAIRHALAAQNFVRVADLVEQIWPAMRRTRQETTVWNWISVLPEPLFFSRPVLSVVYAWVLLNRHELEAAETRLQDAERWLNKAAERARDLETSVPEMIVVDEVQFQSLPAAIANARAYSAQARGDVVGTVTYTQKALGLLPEHDYYERGTTSALLGIAYLAIGNLEAAYQSFDDGLTSLQKGGGILIRIGGTLILADIRRAQGRLRDANRAYQQSLQLATEPDKPVLQGTAELYLGLSELLREQGDLDTAKAYLNKGKALGPQASLPGYGYFWCIAQARLQAVEGNLDSALDFLDEAERLYYKSPLPDIRPIPAMKARIWVRQGNLTAALGWARQQDLSIDDDLSYLHEYEHVTLARLLIAQGKRDHSTNPIHQAMDLLARLLNAAEAGERTGSVIEILVLQAIAHTTQSNTTQALIPLERALTLAEPEGYVRIFMDEGIPMATLLTEVAKQRIQPNYVGNLLTAFKTEAGPINHTPLPVLPAVQPLTEPLVEPLSDRELEILKLIADGLSNREIGDRLFLALDTIKGHNRRIFGKLGVQRRTEAIARARELGLL